MNNEKAMKEKEYMLYISEHISNVKLAYTKYANKLCNTLNVSPILLAMNIDVHDKSKYSDEEFEAYRNYFYPCTDEEKDEDAFNKAWEHHYTVNPHHPQYWQDKITGEIKDMSPLAIAEMLIDWEAMKIKFGGNTYDYYIKERDKKPFSDNTKAILDKVVKEIFKD